MSRSSENHTRGASAVRVFHGWKVVAACFVVAAFGWGLGLFGASVYLQAVTAAHGWPIAEVASAITLFFLVSAAVQRAVGRSIDRWGPRPVLALGAVSIAVGVVLLGQVSARWQLYPVFVLVGIGWSTLSTTGISATVAPWFERHQGRSITLAVMGASMGAILGVPLLLLAIEWLGLGRGLAMAGLVSACTLLPLIAWVLRFRRPADLGLARDGDTPRASSAQVEFDSSKLAATGSQISEPTGQPILLWTAAAGFALGLTVQIGFITHHLALAQPLLGSTGAGLLVSATGVVALTGRLVLARIVDGLNPRQLAVWMLLLQTAALLAIGLWPSASVLIGASLAYGYAIGHVTTLGPVVVRREFGAVRFGAIYGSAATLIQFVSAFGPALMGGLRDAFGAYGPGLMMAALVTTGGAAVLYFGGRSSGR